MQLRFFTIPIHDGGDIADELNRFLAGHRIVSIDRQLAKASFGAPLPRVLP